VEPAESTSDSADDADRSAGAGVEWLRSGPTPSPPPPAAARGSSVPWPAQVAYLPYISPISPYISPISPLYLPYISRGPRRWQSCS